MVNLVLCSKAKPVESSHARRVCVSPLKTAHRLFLLVAVSPCSLQNSIWALTPMLTSKLLSPKSQYDSNEDDAYSMRDAMEMGSSEFTAAVQNPSDISFLSKIDKWSWAAFIAPSDNMLQKSSGFASLDYDTIYNDGELHYLDKRKLGRSVWGFTGTTFIRWFIFVFIGVFTGAIGRFMSVSITYMHKWRNLAFERFAP